MKLNIDLIPETCWYKNLRTLMKRAQWDKLRKKVYADQGNLCCICGTAGRLNCHEAWHYDEERRIQKLMGFHAVCGMCHNVTHFGKAEMLADEDKLDLEAVIRHFMHVNGVSREEFETHKAEAFSIWEERSKHQWQIDLGEWTSLVEQKKAEQVNTIEPNAAHIAKGGSTFLFVCFGGNCNIGALTVKDSLELRNIGALGGCFTTRDRKGRFWQYYEAKESPDRARLAEEVAGIQSLLDRKGAGNGKVEVMELRCERKELVNVLTGK